VDILSRLGVTIDGPFADTLDEVIRGIIKQFGLEDDLEKVSGDNEKLQETAKDYRQAARDLRGVVDDLEAERKQLLKKWEGDAADGFESKSKAFEGALRGEAEDLDTVAELLETAAESCAEAEKLMIELIVEIIETVIAMAATAALLSVITAGAAAAIGPLITAASVATRAMKAVRITARLADKLSELAKRLKLLRRAARLRTEIRRFGSKGPNGYKSARNRYLLEGRKQEDLAKWQTYREAKGAVRDYIVAPVVGQDAVGTAKEAYAEYAPGDLPGTKPDEPTAYDQRPPSQGFNERMEAGKTNQQKIKEDFG
jgi:WXG100 family type VII secretion target